VHRIAQVVQQLANELSLIVVLDPAQNFGVGRRGRSRKARFQIPSPFDDPSGTIARAGEFPDNLKKLPRRPAEAAAPASALNDVCAPVTCSIASP
jgi:hypothetical protein